MSESAAEEVNLSDYEDRLGRGNKLARGLWCLIWALLFRPTPPQLHAWRTFLLRLFGASLGRGVHVYPSCTIWAPWNLEMGEKSCLGRGVRCYNVDRVQIGANVVVSQYSHLCTATHDVEDPAMRLVTAPIRIESQAWVCADVFVAPGLTIGQGAVVGARSSVFRDLPPWTVCTGSPARPGRERKLRTAGE